MTNSNVTNADSVAWRADGTALLTGAALESEQTTHVAVVGIHAPGRVPGSAAHALDLAPIAKADQVKMMDTLLKQHRVAHG